MGPKNPPNDQLLPPAPRATNPNAERVFVRAVRKASRRALANGARPTTLLTELLMQAAAAHRVNWRDRDDFLKWAADLYDGASQHAKRHVH